MGKPAIPLSKSPFQKVLPCPAPIINIFWTEKKIPLFGTHRRQICMQAFFHILLFNSCIQDQPGQAHDKLSHETHVSHKPVGNSQNHNVSLVILLGFIPSPVEPQLQRLTRKNRHLTFWFQAFGHPH